PGEGRRTPRCRLRTRRQMLRAGDRLMPANANGSRLVPASFDQNQRSTAVRRAAYIDGAADASQPLGAFRQAQPIAARPGLMKRRAGAVVLNRHADPTIWILHANTHP